MIEPRDPKRLAAERAEARTPYAFVHQWFSEEIWKPERAHLRGARGAWFRAQRIGYLATRGFLRDQCLSRAAALTYITLLSLVPLLAFSFSVAKGFGFYESLLQETIRPALGRTFQDGGTQVIEFVDRIFAIVDATDVKALGLFGLLVLLYSVIKMLGTVESTLNDIWGVQRSRSFLRKLTDYLAIVVVTPIFVFTAAGVTTAARNSGVLTSLEEQLHLGPILEVTVRLAPLVVLWIGFSFVYLALPNARTRVASALWGGLFAAVLWQMTLLLHLEFQLGIARYNALYSSFAVIPIFLMWLNLSWIVVLLGAEVCFAHQSEPGYVRVANVRAYDHSFRELLALRAMARIGEAFLGGLAPRTSSGLSTELGVPEREINESLGLLWRAGLLVPADESGDRAWLPARDLESVTIKHVIDGLKGTSGPVQLPARTDGDAQIDRLLAELEREHQGSRHNRTLRSLAEAARRERVDEASSAVTPETTLRERTS